MTNNRKFPIREVSVIAKKESWRKEINRPIYHIHKWWAQRLGSVFRAILLYLMEEDANTWESFYRFHDFSHISVLDPFMGSGTTIGETLKLGASAIGCDINPISSFLVKQELTAVSMADLELTYKKLEKSVASYIKKFYKTIDIETGEEIPVLYYFWVKLVTTPLGEEIPLFSRYVFAQNAYAASRPEAQILCPECWGIFQGVYNQTEAVCPHCGKQFNPQNGPANNSVVFDKNGNQYKIKDLIPKDGQLLKEKMYALLAVRSNGEKVYQSIQKYDHDVFAHADSELKEQDFFLPTYEVRPGYNTDQARGYNYFCWKDFFNRRQLLCLGKLLDEILKIDEIDIREQFLCLFSSTLEFNNTFCSYKGEGTGAVRPIFSNHILKPERTPLENSIWGYNKSSGCFSSLYKSRLLKAKSYLSEPFELRIDEKTQKCEKIVASRAISPKICNSWEELARHKNSALILNGNSANLPIPDNTVDFVVTDPPYFDFIHYSELSDFFYAWLSPILRDEYDFFKPKTSGRANEVQQTDAEKFSTLLGDVFAESKRVLKHHGKLVFSFHHSRIDGWGAIAKALVRADLYVTEVFPIHAELMASTPKASAKEPISLDAIICCEKTGTIPSEDTILDAIRSQIREIREFDQRISKTDVFVISCSQCLRLCVNQRLSDSEMYCMMQKIYDEIILDGEK